jgi:hypothetical protein
VKVESRSPASSRLWATVLARTRPPRSRRRSFDHGWSRHTTYSMRLRRSREFYRRSPHRARPRAKSCIRLPGSRPSGLIRSVSEQFCTDTESTHAIFVVWCTERIIKLTRAMTLQLSRGGITRAGLPRPSQNKTARKYRRMGPSERRGGVPTALKVDRALVKG